MGVLKCATDSAFRPGAPYTAVDIAWSAYAAAATRSGQFLACARPAPTLAEHGAYAVHTCPIISTHAPTGEEVSS